MQGQSEQSKNNIRIQCLAARERMQTGVSYDVSKVIAESVCKVVSSNATIVAGYRKIRNEVDPSPALERLSALGYTLCLPVIESSDKPLFFRKWRIEEPLDRGRYGIEIPSIDAPVFRPDTVIVPMVAFDAAGNRLGYGAGYYDRTIRWLRDFQKSVQIIGVAYGMQQVAHIPCDAYDEKMDVIVTEKEIIRFS